MRSISPALSPVSRTSHNPSGLVRLLAAWVPAPNAAAKLAQPDVATQLAQWLSVADSITLHGAQDQLRNAAWVAKALQVPAPTKARASTTESSTSKPNALALGAQLHNHLHQQLHQQLHDLRTTLAASFIAEVGSFGSVGGRGRLTQSVIATDFATHHQRYLEHQRRMEMGIDAFRAHVQQVLATATPATSNTTTPLAQLAALDALLNQMLGARTKSLLSRVPAFLKVRFLALRAQGEVDTADTADTADMGDDAAGQTSVSITPPPSAPHTAYHTATAALPPPAWLVAFEQSFQAALLAELELRLQPIHGMVQALSHTQEALDLSHT